MGIELARGFVSLFVNTGDLDEELEEVRRNSKRTTDSMGMDFKRLIAPILGVAASMGTLRKALMAAGTFEQTTIAFETMIGSAKETQRTLAELTEFAALTPFEMPEIESAARGLIQFGERGDELMETLNMLGNAASGTSTPFGFLALVFNQIRGVGKLLTQDFRQLSTRGILSLQDIASHYKTTTAAAQEMLSKGKISFEDVKAIFKGLSKEGGRFANLMEKQSKSLLGLWSTLKDAANITLRTLGEQLMPVAKKVVDLLIRATEWVRTFVKRNASLTSSIFMSVTAVVAFKTAWVGVEAAAKAAGMATGMAIKAAFIAFGKFLVVVVAVTAALEGIKFIWKQIKGETSDAVKEVAEYNRQIDELIKKKEKLRKLRKEEEIPEEETKKTAEQLLAVEKENALMERIIKAKNKIAEIEANKRREEQNEFMVPLPGIEPEGTEKDKLYTGPKEEGAIPVMIEEKLTIAGELEKGKSVEEAIENAKKGVERKIRIIPTIVGGKKLSEEEAIERAKKEGVHKYPSFDSGKEAKDYLQKRKDYRSKKRSEFSPHLQEEQDRRRAELAKAEAKLKEMEEELEKVEKKRKESTSGSTTTSAAFGQYYIEGAIEKKKEEIQRLKDGIHATAGELKKLEDEAKNLEAHAKELAGEKEPVAKTETPEERLKMFKMSLTDIPEIGKFGKSAKEELNDLKKGADEFKDKLMSAWEKGQKSAVKTLKEMRQHLKDLQTKATETDIATRKFKEDNLGATQEQIDEFRRLHQQIADIQKMEKSKTLDAGRYGFAEYANQIQDALLKKEDPQKTMIKRQTEGNKILASIDKTAKELNLGLV